MRKKWNLLGACSFMISLLIFVFTFCLYHYLGPEGKIVFGAFRDEPVKPFVTFLFGIWGVTFLFASVMSFLIGKIFYSEK